MVLGVRVPDESGVLGRWLVSDTGSESFGTEDPDGDMRDSGRAVTRDDKSLWRALRERVWVTVERVAKEREED